MEALNFIEHHKGIEISAIQFQEAGKLHAPIVKAVSVKNPVYGYNTVEIASFFYNGIELLPIIDSIADIYNTKLYEQATGLLSEKNEKLQDRFIIKKVPIAIKESTLIVEVHIHDSLVVFIEYLTLEIEIWGSHSKRCYNTVPVKYVFEGSEITLSDGRHFESAGRLLADILEEHYSLTDPFFFELSRLVIDQENLPHHIKASKVEFEQKLRDLVARVSTSNHSTKR